MGFEHTEQARSAVDALQPSDIVERPGLSRQQVGLGIVHHLHAVLDRAQEPIGGGQFPGRSPVEPARVEQ